MFNSGSRGAQNQQLEKTIPAENGSQYTVVQSSRTPTAVCSEQCFAMLQTHFRIYCAYKFRPTTRYEFQFLSSK